MAVPRDLTDYVEKQLKSGFAIDEIKAALQSEGWPDEQIYEVFGMVFESARLPSSKMWTKIPGYYGIILSVAVGFLVFRDVLLAPLAQVINLYILPSLEGFNLIGFEGANQALLNTVLGLGIIIGAVLAYRLNERVGGLAIMILSVIFILSGGIITIFALGIIGGILVFIRK